MDCQEAETVGPTTETTAAITTLRPDGQALPPEERFWRLRQAIAPLFDIAVKNSAALGSFFVRLTAHRFAPFLLARIEAGPLSLRRSPTAIARSFGADHFLVLAHGGLVAGRDQAWTAESGDVTIMDLSRPSHFAGAPFTAGMLLVPRASLAPLLNDPEIPRPRHLRKASIAARMVNGHLDDLLAIAGEADTRMAAALAPATLHLLAGCLSASRHDPPTGRRSRRQPVLLLRDLRRYIADNHASPDLSPKTILDAHPVSRATLFRLFEPLGGVSDYIRRYRLARCQADLSTPSMRERAITEIAFAHGFANESVFSRAYSAHFGISPRDTRQAALHGHPTTSDGGEPSAWDEFHRWLLCL